MLRINWKTDTRDYTNGIIGYLGKYAIFNIFWDACTSKDDEEKWKLTTKLPGLKTDLGHSLDQEAAKEKANAVLDHWIEGSGL